VAFPLGKLSRSIDSGSLGLKYRWPCARWSGMPTFEVETRRIVAKLRKDGWIEVGGSKHDKFEHAEGPDALIIVPRHKQQSPGVAR
jgi:predicted RNA binding protein YcfA (HicA-like mRNA interferase family)